MSVRSLNPALAEAFELLVCLAARFLGPAAGELLCSADDALVPVFWPAVSAAAIPHPHPVTTAAPTPSATANPPTRPIHPDDRICYVYA